MDLNILTRVQSHAVDLHKIGLPAIVEENDEMIENQLQETVPANKENRKEKEPKKIEELVIETYVDVAEETKPQPNTTSPRKEAPESTLHYEDLWGAITRNIGKGFVLGYGGKVTVNVLFLLLTAIRGRKVKVNRNALVHSARDYGVFFGLLLGINNGIMYETRKRLVGGGIKGKLNRYRGYIAGFFAGASLIWVPKENRKPIVLFAFVRALELQAKMAANRGLIPNVNHGDTLLMSIASASMIHSWIFSSSTLDPSYVKFLSVQVPIPLVAVNAVARMHTGRKIDIEALNLARKKIGASVLTGSSYIHYDKLNSGEIIHPGKSLPVFFIRSLISGMKRALPVYLPVFSLPVLLFYPLSLVKHPVETMARTMSGVMRSSLFLATYCATGVTSISLMRLLGFNFSNVGTFAHLAPAAAGFLSGLATLIEKKSRRIELALYVLSKAVEGRATQLVEAGLLPNFRGAEILVFMSSLAVIMHAYVRHAKMLRSSYYSILCRFFDTDKRHEFITYKETKRKEGEQ
mmetsp:Transcript_10242/g.11805  ORF Transcript_10242/g.11805 Transcript_10242/m.11805 type:complete len:520 (+) Transcript_10242:220-1779(+)